MLHNKEKDIYHLKKSFTVQKEKKITCDSFNFARFFTSFFVSLASQSYSEIIQILIEAS